jgi:BirA family biotin operon repressor/biotin-[acetyl-CoA-carboxylase] ligase
MKRFDDRKFLKLLDTDKFGRRFLHLPVTESTNDYASEMLGKGQGSTDGTVILADEQTGGRGRFNRGWLSPQGGLWFSLVFKTVLPAEKIPAVTLITAYSAAGVLMDSYDIDVNIKWPNDLYSMDQKFGGILSELKQSGTHQFIIMGMGLNIDVQKKFFKGLDYKAVNIQDLTVKAVEREKLLADILKRFEGLYGYFSRTEDLGPIFKKIEEIIRY